MYISQKYTSMKKHLSFLFFVFLLLTFEYTSAQNVGIGTNTPEASAQLDVTSTSRGLLPPRMTYAQRNAIVSPAAGLIIYCTDCAYGEMQYYNGTNWINMAVGLGSVPFIAPTVTTASVSSITNTTAICGGTVTADGGATVTTRGVVWSTSPSPTIALNTKTTDGTGTGSYTSNITGLTPNTTYYVRAYATNIAGTSYGIEQNFTTTTSGGTTNLSSVTICNQTWTTQNLSVSRYRNGDVIPQVTDATQWQNLTTGAWCWYNNDSATYAATYGRLYNWYAVNDPRGLAPIGWHVPTDAEWNKLVKCIDPAADTTLSGSQSATAGGAMKEAGTSHWLSPNTGATNSSGFAGLPGGYRNYDGTFDDVGDYGVWWSSTEYGTAFAWSRFLNYYYADVARNYGYDKTYGFSVRLVRD